jgi:hypothetical protein
LDYFSANEQYFPLTTHQHKLNFSISEQSDGCGLARPLHTTAGTEHTAMINIFQKLTGCKNKEKYSATQHQESQEVCQQNSFEIAKKN